MDPVNEAKSIAFDRVGSGEKVLLISGFFPIGILWVFLDVQNWRLCLVRFVGFAALIGLSLSILGASTAA
jgi:hypothetical protein